MNAIPLGAVRRLKPVIGVAIRAKRTRTTYFYFRGGIALPLLKINSYTPTEQSCTQIKEVFQMSIKIDKKFNHRPERAHSQTP